MADCVFCENFVAEETGDGGLNGRLIGNRDICESCLAELKFCMEGIEAKRPSERTNKRNDEENEDESNVGNNGGLNETDVASDTVEDNANDENYNPASSGANI